MYNIHILKILIYLFRKQSFLRLLFNSIWMAHFWTSVLGFTTSFDWTSDELSHL